ncbi:transposase [Paraburkholderia graminis]
MTGKDSELKVVRQSRDGRRRYDEGGKRVLIEAALRPGASVARLAQEHGINANLLRKWITKYLMECEKGIALASQETRADERDLPPSSAVDVIAHEDFRRDVDDASIDVAGSRKRLLSGPSPSAFVPVVSTPSVPPLPLVLTATAPMTLSLHVRLSNGVELDLSAASIDELSTAVQMFGRMPCSGSTKI